MNKRLHCAGSWLFILHGFHWINIPNAYGKYKTEKEWTINKLHEMFKFHFCTVNNWSASRILFGQVIKSVHRKQRKKKRVESEKKDSEYTNSSHLNEIHILFCHWNRRRFVDTNSHRQRQQNTLTKPKRNLELGISCNQYSSEVHS